MPIYGYRCSDCGHQFEVLQKMSDAPLQVCPNCQGKLTKVLYPTGVIFKGSGYYTTDYKGSGKSPSSNGSGSDSSSGSDSKPATKSESSGESKSESKSESKDS